MSFGFIDFLELIGSLGVFLFGMKLMSEALQKVAGSKLRNILAAMTSSRIRGVFAGLLITAIIQSSSATTVMLVSFVNAGLLNLLESIGIIMGANIGTTVTAWIISILGFKVQMSFLSLPLIGITMPLFFSKDEKKRSLGEIAMGFAMIFIGLEYLKSSVPDIRSNPDILSFLSDYTDLGLGSFFIFLAIGTLLTVIIQSSSATMALTLVMCSNGWIGFETAAAMVLGENIGTTITANIAATVANTSAKQTARAHFIFNVFGVMWMTLMFPLVLKAVDFIVTRGGAESAFVSVHSVPIALSLFHTVFNITNVLLMLPFAKLIAKTAVKLVKPSEDDEEFHLQYINTGLLATAELSLLQSKKEIIAYSKHVKKMFAIVRNQLTETNPKKFGKQQDKIKKHEEASDRTEIEIAKYLTEISSNHLSIRGSRNIKAYLNIIDNIESISDSIFNLSRTFKRKAKEKAWFSPEIRENIIDMFDLVEKAIDNMGNTLKIESAQANMVKADELETKINKFRNKLRKDHLSKIEDQNEYTYFAGVIYSDLFAESEKLADYVYNVCESYCEIKEN
ncbi:MAG: Na/Pi cotransporter family protein [Bacteroidetes bacterium]|jgi:phosphate:Na+ symporter|nr:Na/Pi cotransporter family protein [Bacteroidota bacterium]MBT4398190.1 Na/Pi cotransporter family protein [Bacteroidota bacterium]MBT4409451.1 Na/Pi cotransporter family protein [Bacteroidota bacterium]MBT5428175.1 Na/Pi cotransporter family protein [Bacteroidota bacterium]MBT7092786.1 Na/Pi cotransporter family protein [Bacteroidota bacterium]